MLMDIVKALNPFYVYRDARTGRFVSRLYAAANPDTTIRQKRGT